MLLVVLLAGNRHSSSKETVQGESNELGAHDSSWTESAKEKASGLGLGKKDEPKTDKVIDGDLIVARARCM